MATSASAEMLSVTPWPDSSLQSFTLPAPSLSCPQMHFSPPTVLIKQQPCPGPYGPCKARLYQTIGSHCSPLQGSLILPFPLLVHEPSEPKNPYKMRHSKGWKPSYANCTFPKVVLSPESTAWKQHTLAGLSLQQHVNQ